MIYEVLLDGKTLYYPNDTVCTIYGGKLTQALNDSGTFEFTVPSTNPLYDSIQNRISMIQILKDGKEIFYGEVRECKETIEKLKEVYCVGELAFLFDSIQPQKRYQDQTPLQFFTALINEHNSQVEEKKKFEVGIVTVTDPNDSIYRYTNEEDTLTDLRDKLCDRLNGYLRIRKENGIRYLDCVKLQDYGKTNQQPIEFGYNLLEYSSNMSGDDIVTAVIPLGARLDESRVEGLDAYTTIESVNDGKDYVYIQSAVDQYGWIRQVQKWDDVTEPENLKKKAEKWLTDYQYESMTLELTAIDMSLLNSSIDSYELGDMVNALAGPLGMDAWFPVQKKTNYIQEIEKDRITLSNTLKKPYTSQSNAALNQLTNEIPQTKSLLQMAKDNATKLITTATNGNIVLTMDDQGNPTEILIMDTKDPKTAKKVWRWNLNGFGYSENGVNGPYNTAITMDGAIVADFITAGTLSGERISVEYTKTLKEYADNSSSAVNSTLSSRINNVDGAITAEVKRATNEENALSSKITETEKSIRGEVNEVRGTISDLENIYPKTDIYPGVDLWPRSGAVSSAEMHTFFDIKSDAMALEITKRAQEYAETAEENANGYLNDKLRSYSTAEEVSAKISAKTDGITQEFSSQIAETRQYMDDAADAAVKNANDSTDVKLAEYYTKTDVDASIKAARDGLEVDYNKKIDHLGCIFPTQSLLPDDSVYPEDGFTKKSEVDSLIKLSEDGIGTKVTKKFEDERSDIDEYYSTFTQKADLVDLIINKNDTESGLVLADGFLVAAAKQIDLNGKVTFSCFDNSLTQKINTIDKNATDAGTAASDAQDAADAISDNIYVKDTTEINGGVISTGTITADKLSVTDLSALQATIGGFEIGSNYLQSVSGKDSSGAQYDVQIRSYNSDNGTDGYAFSVGEQTDSSYSLPFYVKYDGSIYASKGEIAGLTLDNESLCKEFDNGDYFKIVASSGVYSKSSDCEVEMTSGNLRFSYGSQKIALFRSTQWVETGIYGAAVNSEPASQFISFGNKDSDSDKYYNTVLLLNYGLNPDGRSEDVQIYGSTYHSGRIYIGNNTNDYIGAYSDNGIFVNDFFSVNGNFRVQGQIQGSLEFSNGFSLKATKTDNIADGLLCDGRFKAESLAAVSANGTIYTSYQLSVEGSGYASQGFTSGSDRSLKEDFEELADSHMGLIDRLEPSVYRYVGAKNHGKRIGFIAQDVQQAFRDAGMNPDDYGIITDRGDGMLSLSYSDFIPILWKVCQTLRKDVSTLNMRLETMQNELYKQEFLIQDLQEVAKC